jgi:hypothetical protein
MACRLLVTFLSQKIPQKELGKQLNLKLGLNFETSQSQNHQSQKWRLSNTDN